MAYFSKIYSSDLPHRAKELNLSRRTVERAIQDLVKAGLIKKEQRWRENGGKSSLLYTLIDSS